MMMLPLESCPPEHELDVGNEGKSPKVKQHIELEVRIKKKEKKKKEQNERNTVEKI